MISVDINGIRFTHRVGGIAVRDGRVMLNRARDGAYWFIPGGRIEEGEDSRTALVREMREEIGQEVAPGDLVCTMENFFEHGNRRFHELGIYYSMAVERDWEGSRFIEDGGTEVEYRWFGLEELGGLTLYPEIMKEFIAGRRSAGHIILKR